MDEELDLSGYREESCTISDETRQAACATDTLDQGTPDRSLNDVAVCTLRIKQDRRDGHTGIYFGFERRGRLNSQTMRPSAARARHANDWVRVTSASDSRTS